MKDNNMPIIVVIRVAIRQKVELSHTDGSNRSIDNVLSDPNKIHQLNKSNRDISFELDEGLILVVL